jgi:putative acetyltransferase
MKMRIRDVPGLRIRPIEPRDDAVIFDVIRAARREFDVVGQGIDAEEPVRLDLSRVYNSVGAAYWVVELDDAICGGGGVAPYAAVREDVCELQRMYLAPMARGRGVGRLLLTACLDTAQLFGYRQCYLETAASLHQANRLYESAGFRRISEPPGRSHHPACDAFFMIDLPQPHGR